MSLEEMESRKRPYAMAELVELVGCSAEDVSAYMRKGAMTTWSDARDDSILMIEAEDAHRFAVWHASRVAGQG